ncbi:MAG: hypothetical protein HY821_18165 [Acidobacteria bacterium]|nr:hypothetical protein [Acidobacteriota bacterium]
MPYNLSLGGVGVRFWLTRLGVLYLGIVLLGCATPGAGKAPPAIKRLTPAGPARRAAEGAVQNVMVVYSKSAVRRPYTISRIFAQGEILKEAQVSFNGTPARTQCEVRTRWPDGSVQHAVLSFWAETNEGPNELTFSQQEPAEPGSGLSAEEMLSSEYTFGATMELSSEGHTALVDARQMISAGAFRYWLRGPICTQVVIEDRGAQRSFDQGWTDHKPFHPMFVATFYPGWRGVKVEWIGEISWTNSLEDMAYSLTLKAGAPDALSAVYSLPNFKHILGARWRKSFWSGPEPAPVAVNHNLPYLIHTRVLPSYDQSKFVSNAAVEAMYDQYSASGRGEPGDNALWLKYFPTTGGRADIGLFPSWYVNYLYTFDPRLEEVFAGCGNASGSAPIHFREGSSRPYLLDSDVEALGRPISVEARPSFWIGRFDYAESNPNDRIQYSGPHADSGWTVDLSHQPSISFLPYILTGDYYHLEELQFWGALNAAAGNPGDCYYCRHSTWGFINDQTRGNAWGLRTLAHAAWATPDGTPEKTYFTDKVYRNLAILEGVADVNTGSFFDESVGSPWSFGRRDVLAGKSNPLGFMDLNNPYARFDGPKFNADPASPDRVTRINSPWQYNFVHLVLGHIEELGFPAGAVRKAFALNLLHQLTDPACNHYLVADYQNPVLKADGGLYQSWESYARAWSPDYFAIQKWPENDDRDVQHGYPHIARAAASFLPGICDGALCGDQAWNWINQHVGYQDLLKDNPKWAIIPRGEQPAEVLAQRAAQRLKAYRPAPAKTRPKGRSK